MKNKLCEDCAHCPVCKFTDEATKIVKEFGDRAPFKIDCEQFSKKGAVSLNYPYNSISTAKLTRQSKGVNDGLYIASNGSTCTWDTEGEPVPYDIPEENTTTHAPIHIKLGTAGNWACQDAPGL